MDGFTVVRCPECGAVLCEASFRGQAWVLCRAKHCRKRSLIASDGVRVRVALTGRPPAVLNKSA